MTHQRLTKLLERIIKNIADLESRISMDDERIRELEQLLDKIEKEKENEKEKEKEKENSRL
jgi:hypothetical protein